MTSAMERTTATSGGVNGSPQGQQLQEAATGLMEQAARTADAQASTTMTQVGDTLQKVATHIRQAGEELRGEQPQVAGFIDAAAERVDDAATYLRERDASEALENVQRFARNQPALVIGAGLAAGLVIGRILRGGAEAAGGGKSEQGYRDQYRGAYASSGSRKSGYSSSAYGATGYGASTYDTTVDNDLLSDSATGDAVRDEATTARS